MRHVTTRRHRRLVLIGTGGLLCAALAVVVSLARPDHRRPAAPSASAPLTHPVAVNPTPPPQRAPVPLIRTGDPATYARAVATALLAPDPSRISRGEFLALWRGELPTVVYSDAAAKGLTVPAEDSDAMSNLTTSWIPTATAWSNEASDDTVNALTITSVSVPDYWVNAVASGTFRDPGLHMERVMGVLRTTYGTRHRYSSARSVAIDLALLCAPTQPGGCRLLAPQAPTTLGAS